MLIMITTFILLRLTSDKTIDYVNRYTYLQIKFYVQFSTKQKEAASYLPSSTL